MRFKFMGIWVVGFLTESLLWKRNKLSVVIQTWSSRGKPSARAWAWLRRQTPIILIKRTQRWSNNHFNKTCGDGRRSTGRTQHASYAHTQAIASWRSWGEEARARPWCYRLCYHCHRVGPDRCHHARPDTERCRKATGHTDPACQSEATSFSNELRIWFGLRRTSAGRCSIFAQASAHCRQLWTCHVVSVQDAEQNQQCQEACSCTIAVDIWLWFWKWLWCKWLCVKVPERRILVFFWSFCILQVCIRGFYPFCIQWYLGNKHDAAKTAGRISGHGIGFQPQHQGLWPSQYGSPPKGFKTRGWNRGTSYEDWDP